MTSRAGPLAVISPGATIGILGGGQLGRMTALAARSLGYDVHVLDPDPQCAASPLASRIVAAPFDDADAATDLASHCAVVTLEIEQVDRAALEAVSRHAPMRPGAEPVVIIQDRATQKEWLARGGYPVAEFRVVHSEQELADAVAALAPCIAKTTRGGYDGRGQVRFSLDAARVASPLAHEAWRALGGRTLVVERELALALELSVMVARHETGDLVTYPPSVNHHDHGILTWSVTPGALDPRVVKEAVALGEAIATSLSIVGLLAIELFLTRDGTVVVNELAPRPHNSFHQTERACLTSQFEQLVRAVCGLPLGAADVAIPGAIHNLLGDIWEAGEPEWERALAVRGVRLHLYGKRGPRPGRKMGHLSGVGPTAAEALSRVQLAYSALRN